MTSPQKAKGASWERTVANFLSNLYSASFIRTPHSGAFVGGSNASRKSTLDLSQIKGFKGDIVPPEAWPSFNAEAKNYKDFPFHQLFSGEVKMLEEWIGQCMDAADPGDFNILFMKFNNKGKYIATPEHPSLTWSNHFKYTSSHHGTWILMDFESFFETNSPAVKELCCRSKEAN